jgi:pSer/pThr/pTyr-binding forkhead associated (FHA) protein
MATPITSHDPGVRVRPWTKIRLIPLSAHASPLEFAANDLPLVLGRDHSADVQLHDPWVSRRHCEIDIIDNDFLVRDLDSKHGTYVNNVSIVEKLLEPGDELSIGLSTFRMSGCHD